MADRIWLRMRQGKAGGEGGVPVETRTLICTHVAISMCGR